MPLKMSGSASASGFEKKASWVKAVTLASSLLGRIGMAASLRLGSCHHNILWSAGVKRSLQLRQRDALHGLGLVGGPYGADLAAGGDVNGGAFDVGAVASELDNDLAEMFSMIHVRLTE